MGTRYYCDRCGVTGGQGTEIVSRFTLNTAVAAPHSASNLPKFDGELCATCLSQLCDKIKDALASKR